MIDNKPFDDKHFRESLPPEMLAEKRFVLYRLVPKGDKIAKIPFTIHGKGADHSDPNTWSTFDECLEAFGKHDHPAGKDVGIGFCFYKSIWHPFDLDHVRNKETGEICTTVKSIILTYLNSWAEYSVSGTGIHIIFKGEVRAKELLDNGHLDYWNPAHTPRFLALTGNIVEGYNKPIRDVGTDFNFIAQKARTLSTRIREELEKVDKAQWESRPPLPVHADLEEKVGAYQEKQKHKTRKLHKDFGPEQFKQLLVWFGCKVINTSDDDKGHWVRINSCPIKGAAHDGHNDSTCNFIYPASDGGIGFHCQSTPGCHGKGIKEAIEAQEERTGTKCPVVIWEEKPYLFHTYEQIEKRPACALPHKGFPAGRRYNTVSRIVWAR